MSKLSIDKNKLKVLYVDKQHSQDTIGRILNCSQWVISNRLRNFGIPTRPKTRNLVRRKYTYNNNFLKNITPEISWVLGLLVSDGFVSNNILSGYFGLKLREGDKDCLFKVKKILKYNGPILIARSILSYKGQKKVYMSRLLKINDISAVRELESIGIRANKTINENFLECIACTNNEEIINSFIRGIYDGDGSVLYDKQKNSVCFQIVGTSQLLTEIQKYLMLYCHVNKTVLTRNIPNKNHYALRYRGNIQAINILDWIYKYSKCHTRLKRKYDSFYRIRKVCKK